ncbi:SRPBCC family protein [Gellertiella hungarica]|uniref:Uncharacterized protein YndB with AHSA1/START domain n=1 Tax=Gellertiella hungarica TaxID=1572859 RepID=A0A7W6J3U1_9HYPH|nr:SRPBCC family protein [Gellertiella hungarica]MBB4063441.1 uncharacterized protein YndB with AHSA1/START domain [Gellertiella hungarica]
MTEADERARTLEVSRVVNAPRDLVFEVFSTARHIDQWWGPDGFRNETHSMDFSVGGLWHYTMHGPDGKAWPNWIRYRLIERPARLVYDHGGELSEPAHFHGEITFEEEGRHTRVTLRLVFPSLEAVETAKSYGAVAGGQQTLARLDAYLAERGT